MTAGRPRTNRHRVPILWLRGLAVAAVLGALALAGCSAGAEAPSSAGGDNRDVEDGVAGGQPPGDGQPTAPGTPAEQRALIYTGTITVRVDSVVRAADEAIAIAIGAGGAVAGDNRVIEDDASQATLVLRVPTDAFNSTLDRLAGLGTEQSRQARAEDVTETLIDLDARIAAQQASVDRIRALLARAETIADIVAIEGELTRRQADLDSLIQRRARMAGLVALATITVVLHGPSGPIEETEPETGFMAGLRQGWKGFLASVTVVLTVIGVLLPWAIAIGVPVLVVLWLVRRRQRGRGPVPPAPTPPRPNPPIPPAPMPPTPTPPVAPVTPVTPGAPPVAPRQSGPAPQ